MIREVFHIGSVSISPYGILVVLAFVAAFLQLRWGLRKREIGDDEDANALVFLGAVGGIVGGKLYYTLLYSDWKLLIERFGFVWYGGFLVGALAVLWGIRRRKLPAWSTADAAAPALALGYAVGRIGCFLVGDDYGVPSALPWAVAFPVGLPPTQAGWLRSEFGVEIPVEVPDDALLRVHPTQLYETFACLGIWVVGVTLLRRRARRGVTVLTVVVLLALERFAVEFVRAKDDRFLGDFTLAQLISVVLLVVASALWFHRRRFQDEAM